MRSNIPAVLLSLVWSGVLCAQVPATAPTTSVGAPAATPTGKSPSALMQPGVDSVKAALAILKVDKWKVPASIRDETTTNLGSIARDLDGTLPGLLAAADAAPDSVSKIFPAYRNIDALYDVMLRVNAVARPAASAQESAAVTQALNSLDDGRRALGDRMQERAVTGEKRITDLQASLKAVPPPAPAPECPAVPPPTPAKKPPVKKTTPKPAAKPATPPPASN